MESEIRETASSAPQVDDGNLTAEAEATTPEAQPEESPQKGITLKFNKELREIPYSEAVALAQKGMKFDVIRSDFERLKNIAVKNGKSISEFITEIENEQTARRREALLEGCAGNESLTEHILSLEKAAEGQSDDGFSQLTAEFPEIKSPDDIPNQVKECVELLGGNLLAAYLLYNHRQQRELEGAHIKQLESSNSSVGSQQSHAIYSAGDEEFLKGLWNY